MTDTVICSSLYDINNIPEDQYERIKRLVISYCNLLELPRCIERMTNLKCLVCSNNPITTIDIDLPESLQYLDVSSCELRTIESLPTELIELNVTFNDKLIEIPHEHNIKYVHKNSKSTNECIIS